MRRFLGEGGKKKVYLRCVRSAIFSRSRAAAKARTLGDRRHIGLSDLTQPRRDISFHIGDPQAFDNIGWELIKGELRRAGQPHEQCRVIAAPSAQAASKWVQSVA